jgi:acyl carrier protein
MPETTRPTSETIEQRLTDLLCQKYQLDPSAVTLDADLNKDLGLDSLDIAEYTMMLEEEFDLIITDQSIQEWFGGKPITLGGIAGLIRRLQTGEGEPIMAKHSPRFLKIVDEARKHIKELTVEQVKAKLDKKEKFHLVDVREESEWAKDHLPGAVHLGKGIIERDIEEKLPDTGAEIVLYCGGGFRSALAADNLQKMGYTNVWSMDGGIRGWRDKGYPLTSG